MLAQLGHPDMRTPIAQALAFPERVDTGVAALDLVRRGALDVRGARSRALSVHRARRRRARCRRHGAGVLNAANEVAVAAFLAGAHPLHRHRAGVRRSARARCRRGPVRTLDDALAADAEARAVARALAQASATRRLMDADRSPKLGAFLVVLGVLVVFHELGHYVVARWCGVKVLRFSVGFGRVVWSRRFGPRPHRVGGVARFRSAAT